MAARSEVQQLRSMVVLGDGAGVVDALTGRPWPVPNLQLVGDGLLHAVRDGVEGSTELAGRCVDALRERDWPGDEELAEALDAVLGNGPALTLRPLPVDLEELAAILEGDPVHGGGRIDLTTGEVWHQAALEYAEELDVDVEEDPDRWLWVECEGSRDGYRDMVDFVDGLGHEPAVARLSRAISGRGAFRRFRDALYHWPDLVPEWLAFSDDRHRGRARAWLADAGYTPSRTLG